MLTIGAASGATTSCARSGLRGASEQFVLENASPDAVRVSLEIEQDEIVLGRWGPFERRVIILRTGKIPPGSRPVRIVVTAVGAPGIGAPGRKDATSVRSDSYPTDELVRNQWRYSGSRIMAMDRLQSRRGG
jgi:hypothetical protein